MTRPCIFSFETLVQNVFFLGGILCFVFSKIRRSVDGTGSLMEDHVTK